MKFISDSFSIEVSENYTESLEGMRMTNFGRQLMGATPPGSRFGIGRQKEGQ
jgi:hypothetical protein